MNTEKTKQNPDSLPPLFLPLDSHRSIILWLTQILHNGLVLLFPIPHIRHWFQRTGRAWHPGITDGWILLVLSLQVFLLTAAPRSLLVPIICFYLLGDVFFAALHDLLAPLAVQKRFTVRSKRRWFLVTALNMLSVIMLFGVLFNYYAAHFTPHLYDRITALYMSAVTFTTLGYGEFIPATSLARILVTMELAFFILFLAFKLPLAIAIIQGEYQE